MLFTIALVLFAGWVLGIFGVYSVGDLHHVLLLVGLMLTLLSFARTRDEAMREARQPGDGTAASGGKKRS